MNKFYYLKVTLCAFLFFSTPYFAHNGIQSGFHFSQNKGQLDARVLYHSKLHLGDMYLEKDRFTFDLYDPEGINALHKAKKKSTNDPFDQKASSPSIRDREYESNKTEVKKHAYSMIFENSNPNVVVTAEDQIEGYKNYFIDKNPNNWATNISSYRLVKYDGLYDLIDLEIYSAFEWMKYDFIVHPGGDADQISIDYSGVENVFVDENGDLVVQLSTGEVKEAKLVAYQTIDDVQERIDCSFQVDGQRVTFNFPNGYDQSKELIIDPVWVFSTLTGSTADNWGFTSTYDSQGNLYAAGIAFSSGYPTTAGAYSTGFLGSDFDMTVTKYNSAGTAIIYSTYLGGSNGNEMPHSLVNNSQDQLVILGSTGSSNFPTTAGAYDETFNGGFAGTPVNMWGNEYSSGCDIALTVLDGSGALVNSTFVGGTDNEGLNESMVYNYADQGRGEVVLDDNDNIYVCTSVWSADFPVTNGSVINNGGGYGAQDAVVFKMNNTLSNMDWGTYYGGTGFEAGYTIRITNAGIVYIGGGTTSSDLQNTTGTDSPTFSGVWDGFIANLDGTSGALIKSTYQGTAQYDQTFILDVDDVGDVYTVGQTTGSYNVVNAAYSDANSGQFIHKLSGDLTTTDYSTVFGAGNVSGGSGIDISLTAFLVDNCGNTYVSGWGGGYNNSSNSNPLNPQTGNGTSTNGMPTTGDAQQPGTDGDDFYFFVLERDAQSMLYGTYFGSSGTYEHTDGGTSRFDPDGIVYQSVCAACGTGNFPTTPGVYSSTSGSGGCNMGAIKFEMNFQGVEAQANIPEDITLCASPFNVDFDAPTTDPPPSAEWIYGDGNASGVIGGSVSPSHVYSDTGTYQVTYIAIDPSSCNIRDTAYFDLTLIQPEQFNAQINVPPVDPCNAPDSLLVSVAFTGTGADSLVWDMGNGDVFYDSTSLDYYYTSQGTYTISMTAYDLLCNNQQTITETFDYLVTGIIANATAPPDTSFCGPPPYNMDFSATTASPHHFWDFGDGSGSSVQANPSYTYNTPGNYDIMYVAIDSTTCNIADTVYFNVDIAQAEALSAEFNLPAVEPCTSPDSILVELAFTGTGADSLSWNMGDGSTFEDSTSINYYYTDEGQYVITMQAWDFYCNVFEEVTDTVNFFTTFSEANADDPGDIFLCTTPLIVDFSAGQNSTPDVFWDFGDGSGTSTAPNPSYTYSDTGIYEVMFVAIDSSTCNIADTVYFNVLLEQAEVFSAELNFTPPPPCGSSTALVEAAFTGTGADSIVWDMGNGDTFNTDSINYVYTEPGLYIVSMTAYDHVCNNVETVSDTVNFIGEVISQAVVPNIFTPNGDGDNDILRIPGIDGTADFYMIIYNRWGRKVFESELNGTFWDGTVNGGADASDGVYFYEVMYRDVCTDEDKIETGHVNLAR